MNEKSGTWAVVWQQFKKNKIGMCALCLCALFFFVGLYAPLFASSKPLLVYWDNTFYTPLLRYLFYRGYYTKPIDLFFNVLMVTFPLFLCAFFFFRRQKKFMASIVILHCCLFGWLLMAPVKNPAKDHLGAEDAIDLFYEDPILAPFAQQQTWTAAIATLSPYTKLNYLLEYKKIEAQQTRLASARELYLAQIGREMPTLWSNWERNETSKEQQLVTLLKETDATYKKAKAELPILIEAYRPFSHALIMAKYALEHAKQDDGEEKLNRVIQEAAAVRADLVNARHAIQAYEKAQGELEFLKEKRVWLTEESQKIKILIPPLVRSFHWEEDAGGAQDANQYIPWWELTRINRKDLVASLLFGIRVSIVVGFLAVLLSLLVGIPLGTLAGYFAGTVDLIICRLIEVWEAMPTFFMLLLIVAITQSKSIFLIISVLGLFGWTGFGRFIRSEVLKQRKLPYVEACHSLGFGHARIMFSQILPNAIPPILTLLPFSMMAAITSEAGLSFLGLGEEGSTSWGVLMDEGRSVFPGESYLLWPPAILLTLFLISIALVGDTLRDALDPKMRH
jgi:peptide/nickel transport system permease protein